MSTGDRDLLYVLHIQERIERIEETARQGRDAFYASHILQDAVIRNFEVIGEAVKRLSSTLTAGYPDVPWRRVSGFRDVFPFPSKIGGCLNSDSVQHAVYCSDSDHIPLPVVISAASQRVPLLPWLTVS